MRLVQRRQRNKPFERFERLGRHPHRRRVFEASVNDPMPDGHQPVTYEVARQEVSEVLDRAIVTERRPVPGLLGDDAAGRVMCLEPRCRVQAFDHAPDLEREPTGPLHEYGELDARGTGVQHEDGVVGFAHGPQSPAASASRRVKSSTTTERGPAR